MLILLALYHLGWSSVKAFPIQARDESISNSCDSLQDCRSVSDIIWSCLTTIFLCTWVAIHPNISYPVCQENMRFWQRRIHEMSQCITQGMPLFILALLFPEYILGWAIKQRMVADRIANEARENCTFLIVLKIKFDVYYRFSQFD